MPSDALKALPLSQTGTVTWIHIGDTHLTRATEANAIDLGRIVDEINETYSEKGVDFVYVPGDIADDGSAAAYEVFRNHLDRLKLPWFGIVGDHDVHEKAFRNFQRYVDHELFSSFQFGRYRFFRVNAFSEPTPESFAVDQKQLDWLESGLRDCVTVGAKAVLFLHCYPSDLKRGGKELHDLTSRYPVLLIDMGHTHYNEISNDGLVLYSATRSTGQVEEGPVGYSLTTLDGDAVSWEFVPLGSNGLVSITLPQDARLTTKRTASTSSQMIEVHAKFWAVDKAVQVEAAHGTTTTLLNSVDGCFFTGILNTEASAGKQELKVKAATASGLEFQSAISLPSGEASNRSFDQTDQANAIGAWQERGILGTQLGPNKNGRKW